MHLRIRKKIHKFERKQEEVQRRVQRTERGERSAVTVINQKQ